MCRMVWGSFNLTMRRQAVLTILTLYSAAVKRASQGRIEKTEIAYNLPKKKLIEWGYCLIDKMREDYAKSEKKVSDVKTILIAPSWQKDNIVDNCLEELLDNLRGHGRKIIVRPHPQHVRHKPEKMEGLKERYKNDTDIEIQTDFSSNSTVFEADMIITDWSDISFEYAYTTCKPVLFIDTPMKVMNPEYKKIDTEPINIWMRNVIGETLKLDEIGKVNETVERMLDSAEMYHEKIDNFAHEYLYNMDAVLRLEQNIL